MSIVDAIFLTVKDIQKAWNLEVSWEVKHEIIFEVWKDSPKVMCLEDYCDPDTSYEEDVTALYQAIMEKYGGIIKGYLDDS